MTQVTIANLDDETLVRLKRLAWEQGVTPSEMTRRLLTDLLKASERSVAPRVEMRRAYRPLRERSFSLDYAASF